MILLCEPGLMTSGTVEDVSWAMDNMLSSCSKEWLPIGTQALVDLNYISLEKLASTEMV